MSTTNNDRSNASSRFATVKLYPAFITAFAKTFADVPSRPHNSQTYFKNLSPLCRFYAMDTPLHGFTPSRPQLNRVMSHPGVMTSIMVESARIRHFKSLKGQRKIVCLTAYSAPMTHALDPPCDLLQFSAPPNLALKDHIALMALSNGSNKNLIFFI